MPGGTTRRGGRRGKLSVLAPAKINMYLHVTGRRDNGYHTLDSLVCFADVGDMVRLESADSFSFEIDGPYESAFSAAERDASPDSANLAVRAAWALARAARKDLRVKMTLTKNLPLASGIGGGSSDAAAAVWALCEWWGIARGQASYLPDLLLRLGADVPVCFDCAPVLMRGIGEDLRPVSGMDEMPVLLVNPGKPCPTARVFAHYDGAFRAPVDLPDAAGWADFLRDQDNDLTGKACLLVPEIALALSTLRAQDGVRLARMCGSGASCYALCDSEGAAEAAADRLRAANPDWWVRPAWLNRAVRY